MNKITPKWIGIILIVVGYFASVFMKDVMAYFPSASYVFREYAFDATDLYFIITIASAIFVIGAYKLNAVRSLAASVVLLALVGALSILHGALVPNQSSLPVEVQNAYASEIRGMMFWLYVVPYFGIWLIVYLIAKTIRWLCRERTPKS